jgi:hypothetical protein
MTHADLVNDAFLWFLIVMTLLLVMCVVAVFFAPAEAASSPISPRHKAPAAAGPLPTRRTPAATPSLPLSVRQPRAARPTPAAVGWSGADDATQEFRIRVLTQNKVERPKVSGKPPWDPAPKPFRLGR